jgi:hypothetical protein
MWSLYILIMLRHPVAKKFTTLHPTTLNYTSLHLSTLRNEFLTKGLGTGEVYCWESRYILDISFRSHSVLPPAGMWQQFVNGLEECVDCVVSIEGQGKRNRRVSKLDCNMKILFIWINFAVTVSSMKLFMGSFCDPPPLALHLPVEDVRLREVNLSVFCK